MAGRRGLANGTFRSAALLLLSSDIALTAAFSTAAAAAAAAAHSSFAHRGMIASSRTTLRAKSGDGPAEAPISVAVIGGGIAGLSCASELSRSSAFEPTVFDTGRLRPGGRCSSRLPGDEPKNAKGGSRSQILGSVVVDHAAQILSVPEGEGFDEFRAQVERWEEDGVVRKFPPGSVCEIISGKSKEDPFRIRKIDGDMYYGVNGMNSIPKAISSADGAQPFPIEQDVWVSPNNGVKFVGSRGESSVPKWKVTCNGRALGTFDRLVIAHNGKCADRLMSRTPAKALHSLLRTNFSPTVPKWGGKRMTLNSIYSYTFALKKDGSPLAKALGEDVTAAFVSNEPNLRFLTCQTRKDHGGMTRNDRVEVWTVLSSPKFAKKFKAPQENIPKNVAEEVTDLLLQSLEKSLSLEQGTLTKDDILDSKLQLWGAAVPLNVWVNNSTAHGNEKVGSGFLFDADNGVGACGDWLLDPSIGGAWESGRRLGEWMAAAEEGNMPQSSSVGLPPDGSFRASDAAFKAGIGNVR